MVAPLVRSRLTAAERVAQASRLHASCTVAHLQARRLRYVSPGRVSVMFLSAERLFCCQTYEGDFSNGRDADVG